MRTVSEALLLVGALSAALAGARFMWRGLRRMMRTLDVIERLLHRELTRNGGASMKDDTHGTAVAVQALTERLEVLEAARADREDDAEVAR